MSQLFYIHPDNPQPRLINQTVDVLRKGGVIVYPTDSGYALCSACWKIRRRWHASATFVSWAANTTLP